MRGWGLMGWMIIGNSKIGPVVNGASATTLVGWFRLDTLGASIVRWVVNTNAAGGTLTVMNTNLLRGGGRSSSADGFQSVTGNTTLTHGTWYHAATVLDSLMLGVGGRRESSN